MCAGGVEVVVCSLCALGVLFYPSPKHGSKQPYHLTLKNTVLPPLLQSANFVIMYKHILNDSICSIGSISYATVKVNQSTMQVLKCIHLQILPPFAVSIIIVIRDWRLNEMEGSSAGTVFQQNILFAQMYLDSKLL